MTDIDDLTAVGCTLAVWAHPDDETYLAGGLMAALRDAGHRVVVVTATRGEQGSGERGAAERVALAELRGKEIIAALATLGVVEHRWLGYADGSCADADPGEAAARLLAVIEEVRPATVVTFGPDGFTGHPDHIAVGAWVGSACSAAPSAPRLWHPVVTRERRDRHREVEDRFGVFALGEPRVCRDDELVGRVRLSGPSLARKVAALRQHASQTTQLIAAMGGTAYADWVSEETFAATADRRR